LKSQRGAGGSFYPIKEPKRANISIFIRWNQGYQTDHQREEKAAREVVPHCGKKPRKARRAPNRRPKEISCHPARSSEGGRGSWDHAKTTSERIAGSQRKGDSSAAG